MKASLLISQGTKQIILTPDDDEEKMILKQINSESNISMALKKGSFGSASPETYGVKVAMCGGGYLRAFEDRESLILVIENKKHDK